MTLSSRTLVVFSATALAVATADAARAGQLVMQGGGGGGGNIQVTQTIVTGGIAGSGNLTASMPMLPVTQTGTGVIAGQVIDAGSGRPVSGAIVQIGGAPAGNMMRLAMPGGVQSGPPLVPRLMADADGRFAFLNLPKGTYNLQASKPGLLNGAYGRLRPNGPSQSIDLDDAGRVGDVVIRMFHSAVITGRVADSTGEPVVGVQVRALRRSYVAGRRTLATVGPSAQTDDRGVYRLSNLEPGEYVIAVPFVQASVPADFRLQGRMPPDLTATMVTPGNTSFSFSSGGTPVGGDDRFLLQGSAGLFGAGIAPDANGALQVFPTSYYPSASTPGSAIALNVASGEERSGIDVVLNLVPSTTISGRLIGPDGPVPNFVLHLVPTETGEMSADPDVATAITDTNGEFRFLGVPAGQYVIQTVRVPRPQPVGRGTVVMFSTGGGNVSLSNVTVTGGPPPVPDDSRPAPEPEPTLWTATPVSVGGREIRDLTITLSQGAKASGRVEFEGSAQRPNPDQMMNISVVVDPADGRQRQSSAPARVDRSGQFTTAGLLPGKYLVRAAGAPGAWTLKSVTLGGVDVSETPMTVEGDAIGGLIVTFTDHTSSLRGTVRAAPGRTEAPDNAGVIVFPADNSAWRDYGTNPRRMRTARVSKTGSYQIGQVPPGDYYVIAINEEFLGDWQDPRFLDQLSRDAERVTIGDGDSHTQDLTVRDVRPIGGAPAPALAAPAPVAWPADDVPGVRIDDAPVEWAHGPFVPDAGDLPQAPQRDTRVQPTTGTGSLSGTVLLDDGGSTPVRRARVVVRNPEAQVERAEMTDDAGRFSIGSLPPGVYSLVVTRQAYVSAYYGATRAGRVGTPITLAAGQQLTGLDVRMPRGAVITGRVIDDTGTPVPGVAVRLMQRRFIGGERTMSMVPTSGPSQTDDTGTYRIYGLTPGTYVLQVTPPFSAGSNQETLQASTTDLQRAADMLRQPATPSAAGAGASGQGGTRSLPPSDLQPMTGQAVGYAPVYYPGTTNAGEASTVTVAAGQELAGIDIPMRLVPMARIEGVVVGPDGQPARNVQIRLVPADRNNLIVQIANLLLRTTPDGRFQAINVAPGHYTVSARSTSGEQEIAIDGPGGAQGMFVMRQVAPAGRAGGPPPPPDREPAVSLWAEQDIDVNGADVSGISLALQEGMKVSGRVRFEAHTLTPPDPSQVRVSLQPAGAQRVAINLPAAQVGADGTFTFAGVPPGEYRLFSGVLSSGGPAGWTLKSAVVDGKDTLDDPFEVPPGRDVQNAVVTFTDQPSELAGHLTDASGRPVSGLTILVFTTDRALWTTSGRRVHSPVRPNTDGAFRVTGLPAGEYYLAAVTDVDQADWGDPAFMEQVAAAAIKITIAEGEKKVQDIRLAGGAPDPIR